MPKKIRKVKTMTYDDFQDDRIMRALVIPDVHLKPDWKHKNTLKWVFLIFYRNLCITS